MAGWAAVSKTSQGRRLSRSLCHHPRVWSSRCEPNQQREFSIRTEEGLQEKGDLGRDLKLPREACLDPLGQNLVTRPHLSAGGAEANGVYAGEPSASQKLSILPAVQRKRRGRSGEEKMAAS